MHDAGVVAINTTVPTEIVIASIKQNIQEITGIAIAISEHIIQLSTTVIPTAVMPANIDDILMHKKQEHSPISATVHAPAIGIEHNANSGHINVDIHIDNTHGVYINNAIPTRNNTIYETTDRATVHAPTMHIIIHSTIELIMVRERTVLIHRKQLHSPTNATNHTPAKEKNMAPNSGQTHIAKVTAVMHGVYTNAAIPTINTAMQEITDEIAAKTPSKHITQNAIRDNAKTTANVAMHATVIHTIKEQNIIHASGIPHTIIKHAINAKNAKNAARDIVAIVNATEVSMKQHRLANTTAHIPDIGIEHNANIGQIIVAKHSNSTHGVNINNPTPMLHVSKYESIARIVAIALTAKAVHIHTDRTDSTAATIKHTAKIRKWHTQYSSGISTNKNSHIHGILVKKRQTARSKNII
jgi:hypothetical protein